MAGITHHYPMARKATELCAPWAWPCPSWPSSKMSSARSVFMGKCVYALTSCSCPCLRRGLIGNMFAGEWGGKRFGVNGTLLSGHCLHGFATNCPISVLWLCWQNTSLAWRQLSSSPGRTCCWAARCRNARVQCQGALHVACASVAATYMLRSSDVQCDDIDDTEAMMQFPLKGAIKVQKCCKFQNRRACHTWHVTWPHKAALQIWQEAAAEAHAFAKAIFRDCEAIWLSKRHRRVARRGSIRLAEQKKDRYAYLFVRALMQALHISMSAGACRRISWLKDFVSCFRMLRNAGIQKNVLGWVLLGEFVGCKMAQHETCMEEDTTSITHHIKKCIRMAAHARLLEFVWAHAGSKQTCWRRGLPRLKQSCRPPGQTGFSA